MKKLIFSFVLLGSVFMTNLFGSWYSGDDYEWCYTMCQQELGVDECSQGIPFTNCIHKCMGTSAKSIFSILSIFLKG